MHRTSKRVTFRIGIWPMAIFAIAAIAAEQRFSGPSRFYWMNNSGVVAS
jgi:hypothetical protein